MQTTDRKITIVEIAKACGVSKTTVGYALNENTASKVSPEKIALINSTVNRLGYVPNQSAKALKTQKTNIIGVMLPDPDNNFHGQIAIKLQKKLAAKGYTALFVFWNDYDDFTRINSALKMFASHGVDGIITSELPGVNFENSSVPIVFWQNGPDGFDSVSNCDFIKKCYRKIVRNLKTKGCRKFALMVPNLQYGRTLQILEVLGEENVYPPKKYIKKVFSRQTARKGMRDILRLKERPDVILGNNDAIALSAMSEALNNGINVPEEIKFVGFDGTEEAEYSFPSLTTFHVSVDELTEQLLKLLFRRIENSDAEIRTISVEPKLIIRNSI